MKCRFYFGTIPKAQNSNGHLLTRGSQCVPELLSTQRIDNALSVKV